MCIPFEIILIMLPSMCLNKVGILYVSFIFLLFGSDIAYPNLFCLKRPVDCDYKQHNSSLPLVLSVLGLHQLGQMNLCLKPENNNLMISTKKNSKTVWVITVCKGQVQDESRMHVMRLTAVYLCN